MNFRELFIQAQALSDTWKTDGDEPRGEVFNRAGVREAEQALTSFDTFIPTGYGRLDALVLQHRPSLSYAFTRNTVMDSEGKNYPQYQPSEDRIVLPPPAAFLSPEHYARTLAHEFAHWTQAEGRAYRDPEEMIRVAGVPRAAVEFMLMITHNFPAWLTAMEELVAETVAVSLIRYAAVPRQEDYSVHYARAWLDHINNDMNRPITESMTTFIENKANEALQFLKVPA